MLLFTGTMIGGLSGAVIGLYIKNNYNFIRHDAILIGFINGSMVGLYISTIIEINKFILNI